MDVRPLVGKRKKIKNDIPKRETCTSQLSTQRKQLAVAANAAWLVFDKLNSASTRTPRSPRNGPTSPCSRSGRRSSRRSAGRAKPIRLCPKCVPEIRQQILDGKMPVEILKNEKVGEIKAQIIERDGKILMVKDCPIARPVRRRDVHRPGVLASTWKRFSPAATSAPTTTKSFTITAPRTITHGRGSVLTIDLTNRCNMMCDPCFMDANQVGFVHELSWEDIKTLLDNAISIKPRRQMSVQFSGGEPTLSPYFLDAVRYCPQGRISKRAGRDQRHRVRQEPRVLQAGRRGGSALRLSAVRRHRQRSQFASRRRQPVRREAAGDRESLQRRRRYRPGYHDHQRHQ